MESPNAFEFFNLNKIPYTVSGKEDVPVVNANILTKDQVAVLKQCPYGFVLQHDPEISELRKWAFEQTPTNLSIHSRIEDSNKLIDWVLGLG